MSPTIPAVAFEPMQPGSIKAAQKQFDVKSGDSWMVAVDDLREHPDFNIRVKGTEDYEAHITNLMGLIKANGFYNHKPIAAYIAKEDEQDVFKIVDGHCRFEAVKRLIAEGEAIQRLPVIVVPRGTNDVALIYTVGATDQGKSLTPFERGLLIRRAIAYGQTEAEVAKGMNLTTRAVGDLLEIVGLPGAITNMILAGKVKAHTALATYRHHGKEAAGVLRDGLAEAKAVAKSRGKSEDAAKVMPKHLKKERKPKASPPPAAAEAKQPDALDAIDYALTLPAGLQWLRSWRQNDADAHAELADHLAAPAVDDDEL